MVHHHPHPPPPVPFRRSTTTMSSVDSEVLEKQEMIGHSTDFIFIRNITAFHVGIRASTFKNFKFPNILFLIFATKTWHTATGKMKNVRKCNKM